MEVARRLTRLLRLLTIQQKFVQFDTFFATIDKRSVQRMKRYAFQSISPGAFTYCHARSA